jgi:pimeloyl-ACP methyl ester carboxylesterase
MSYCFTRRCRDPRTLRRRGRIPQLAGWKSSLGQGASWTRSSSSSSTRTCSVGSTGPSSVDPAPGEPYATRFPVISIFDMVRAQFALLDHLGIEKLYASVGSSMGGAMQSLASGWIFPKHVGKAVSIGGTARSSPLNHRASPYGTRNAVYVFIVGCSIRSVVIASSSNLQSSWQSLWRIQIGRTNFITTACRHILVPTRAS